MANNVALVTTGKPKKTGAIFRAPYGTTLPTTSVATLDSAFKLLGYVSEDGVTNSNSPETATVKAWGGDTVLTTQNEKNDTFSFKLIEALNADVLKTVYGDNNVSGASVTDTNGITVTANADELPVSSWVIDMIVNGNYIKRIVIPAGKVSEIGDIEYVDDDAVGYEITVSCMPDETGMTHKEFINVTTAPQSQQ